MKLTTIIALVTAPLLTMAAPINAAEAAQADVAVAEHCKPLIWHDHSGAKCHQAKADARKRKHDEKERKKKEKKEKKIKELEEKERGWAKREEDEVAATTVSAPTTTPSLVPVETIVVDWTPVVEDKEESE